MKNIHCFEPHWVITNILLSFLLICPCAISMGADITEIIPGLDLHKIDADHRPVAIECARDLALTMRAIFAKPEAKLTKLLEAQADVALLKVAYNFLKLNEIEQKIRDKHPGDKIVRELKKHVSGPETKQTAEYLNDFYTYISSYEGTSDRPADDKQEKTLQVIKNFSETQNSSDPVTKKFQITNSDLFVFRNLYKKYSPGNLPGNPTLMDTMYDQLGRNFRIGNLDKTISESRGLITKFDQAKQHFAKYVKGQLRDYLTGKGQFANSPKHYCQDFIDVSKSGKIYFKENKNVENEMYDTAFPCLAAFISSLQNANPIADVTSVLNFMQEQGSEETLGKIDPRLHTQQLLSSQPPCKGNCANRCTLMRKENGDWWVTLNVYLEHLTGKGRDDASWFVNTGKEIARERVGTDPNAKEYYKCAGPMTVAYYGAGTDSTTTKTSSNTNATSFASDDGCIDRPVYRPRDYKHEGTLSIMVNLGDTRQDFVTLYGKGGPIEQTGAGPMLRRLSITECKGRDTYTSGTNAAGEVRGIEVIKEDDGVASGLKLLEDKIIVQAKTTPTIFRNGTYRWTCPNNGADVPESVRGEVCNNVRSLYPIKNAEFKRAETDYVVQVQYFSSVQRQEAGTVNLTVPKSNYKIPIVAIEENSDGTNKAITVQLKAKYAFTEGEGIKAEKESFKWRCSPEDSCSQAPGDIVAEENIYSEWKSFNRKEADYEVVATFTSKKDLPPAQQTKFKIAKKECNVDISEDQTPEDNSKATFKLRGVVSNDSIDDISSTGIVEWRYKSPSGSDIIRTDKILELARGMEDIQLKAVFKIGSVEVCSSREVTMKKGLPTEDAEIELLEEIPLSPPPRRFTPTFLPPRPSMSMMPGFD